MLLRIISNIFSFQGHRALKARSKFIFKDLIFSGDVHFTPLLSTAPSNLIPIAALAC